MSPAPRKDEGRASTSAAERPDLRVVGWDEAPAGSPIADEARQTFEWGSTLAGAIEMLDGRSPAELVARSAMRIAVQLADRRVADHRRAHPPDTVTRLVEGHLGDLHWEPGPPQPDPAPLPRSPLSDRLEQTREWRAELAQATSWLEESSTPAEVVLDHAMRRAVELAARYLADQERVREASPRPRNTSLLAGKRGLIAASVRVQPMPGLPAPRPIR
jgi:hypothetical protein